MCQLFHTRRARSGGIYSAPCNCHCCCIHPFMCPFPSILQVLKQTQKLIGSIGGLIVVKRYPLVRFSRQLLFTFTDLLGEYQTGPILRVVTRTYLLCWCVDMLFPFSSIDWRYGRIFPWFQCARYGGNTVLFHPPFVVVYCGTTLADGLPSMNRPVKYLTLTIDNVSAIIHAFNDHHFS